MSSGNNKMILKSLSTLSVIEHLDMSKCAFDGNYQALADLIISNKNLKQIVLKKVALNDQQGQILVGPIADSVNLSHLNLDFNNLGSTFIVNLCAKMLSNPM